MSDFTKGDIVIKGDRQADDAMAYFIFDEWSDTRPSNHAGRIADLTWAFNGTSSCSWERDIRPSPLSRDEVKALVEARQAENPNNRAICPL